MQLKREGGGQIILKFVDIIYSLYKASTTCSEQAARQLLQVLYRSEFGFADKR